MGAGFELSGVEVRFGSLPALAGLDLAIEAGEALALVGPSGSGKTTLLRLLNGTLRPTAGRVAVDGVGLETLSGRALRKLRARVGFVHQDLRLVPNLRVSQNVLSGMLGRLSLPGSLRALLFPKRTDLARAHALLEEVGIPEKLFERTDSLSGGQQQRVALARMLMQDPAAVLADEPVSSVDPARARETVRLLADLCREKGLTLITSLHQLDLAREHFPRLVGLRHGRIAFDRPAAEVAEEEFRELYRLAEGEVLEDGA